MNNTVTEFIRAGTLGKLEEDRLCALKRPRAQFRNRMQRSSTAMHEAAISSGGIEIPPTSVVYKHAGKMYMFDAASAANNQGAIKFQSQFDDD